MIKVGPEPRYLAVGAGSVWVTSYGGGDVYRIDPKTNKVMRKIAVGPVPQAISVDRRGVWVGVFLDGSLVRLDAVARRFALARHRV